VKEKREGFTLLEAMVSAVLLALLTMLCVRVFSAALRTVNRGAKSTLLEGAARSLRDCVFRDVSQALVRTNVPFRVSGDGTYDALYFVSVGMRRQLGGFPRDFAPMRWGAEEPGLPTIRFPFGSAVDSPAGNFRLILHSDFEFPSGGSRAAEFSTLRRDPPETMPTRLRVQSSFSHAVNPDSGVELSFLRFVVNADPSSNRGGTGPPDPRDAPRFVDVVFGLHPVGEPGFERIYAFRVPLIDRGAAW